MSPANESEFQIQIRNGKIFSHARQKWLDETPDERGRLPEIKALSGFET